MRYRRKMFGRKHAITQREPDSGDTDLMEISDEEARAVFDQEARRLLNVSGDEFERRWHAGEYKDCTDPKVTQVAMLLPDAW